MMSSTSTYPCPQLKAEVSLLIARSVEDGTSREAPSEATTYLLRTTSRPSLWTYYLP